MTSASPSRIEIAGTPVDRYAFRDVVSRILERARSGGEPVYVVTPNAHHVSLLQDSEQFRAIYREAWLSLADGISVVWAARLLGSPLPDKISGSDLFPALCKAAAGTGLRVFLMGGQPRAADLAARTLQARYPGLLIAGTHCPPFGFEKDPVESERAVQAVIAGKADILFVALGAPKQEIWMYENRFRHGVPVSIGVGASFDLTSGLLRRAPKWMRKAGLEWFHRVLAEPRRLGGRYLRTNPRFIWLVLQQFARSRRASSRSA